VSSYPSSGGIPSFRTVLDTCAQSPDLPFRDVLTEAHLQALADEEGAAFGDGPGCVWSVALTLWTFLSQMLSKDKSCAAAVARAVVLLVALGREPCAAGTGAYCKARAKLPERFLQRLACDVGRRLEDEAPAGWRWPPRRCRARPWGRTRARGPGSRRCCGRYSRSCARATSWWPTATTAPSGW
jgi:hypothetical protein